MKTALLGGMALASIWSGLWWVGTGILIDRIGAWIVANSSESNRYAHGAIGRAGFPFAIAATIPDAVVASPGYSATTPALRLTFEPWAPGRLRFHAPEPTTLGLAGAPILRIARIDAALDRTPDDRERLTLDLLAPAGAIPGQPEFAADRLQITVTRKPGDPTPVTASAEAWALRSSASPERVDLRFEALWRGLLPASIIDLGAWRDAGGEFELRDVFITNGATRLSGGAVFALDPAMRPVPKGIATIQGIKPFLERLTALGVTSPRDAAIGQTAFALMARPGADGQPEVTLPLSGRDGWLLVGPLRVARLPSLPGAP